MSKRYIFNERLNRQTKRRYWVAGAVVTFLLFNVVAAELRAQESPQLINPNAEAEKVFKSTLKDIDFTRGANGLAVTTLTMNNRDVQPQVIEANGKLILTLPATELAEDQLIELDVTAFGTQVTTIETFQEKDSSRIEFNYAGNVMTNTEQDGKTLTVTISPMSQEQLAKLEKSQYEGEPISLDFQDVPVRQVLQIIAKVNGFNLVTTDTVTGNVSISLTGVPWDQALDMILKIKGLDKRQEGNILLIAPSEELSQRETQKLQSDQQVAQLAPLASASITVNYAKAAELSQILKAEEGGGGILTDRGTVTVDSRTNTILVRDTQASIDEARRVIESLDIPVKQVLIESRMVTVRDNVDEQLGVRWGFSDRQDDNGVSGSLSGAETIAGGNVPALGDRLNVNLPVASAAGSIGFQIASLADGTILDLELSALESENKGEIIASPRITVANQQEAYIEQGTEIPYSQATSSGATSVEFKKAVLSLKVTPHITPDNRIILDLIVTQDTRGETVQTATGDAVAIDTQEIKTQVLVENGETIVLGGIFQQVNSNDVSKVPLFGDLPVVGALFRNSSTVYQKRELLIFVTPKIVTEAL
ncbi:MAG: type IV pilus secretin PilQ family protein [Pseudomonadota bacterium]|jgi:type IV pilus assembly protein PilQ|nr:type IV pilus secretin PilQ [Alteromonadaceae bacterium]MCP4863074.1 type IV pilus secretin PilQ family protein [Alteromonas sp.]MDY6925720.1 type IV pilus secretin PilQ family protein [Pseudomonadota bacterium]RPH14755.1 MAG: type IV pilus secretin PilQ family protein [Alteromonadaceae bacterium TMED7]|tara:strand:+ start:7917 stop:9692 length:1776 start_codon:yes stop_codon:yes gene_type:complete